MKILLLLLLSALPAVAKIGDTPAQANAVYGTPSEVKTNAVMETRTYAWKERVVDVAFVNGRSISERVTGSGTNLLMEIPEVMRLAKLITGRDDWKQKSFTGHEALFEAGEFHLALLMRKGQPTRLMIGGKAYDAFVASEKGPAK